MYAFHPFFSCSLVLLLAALQACAPEAGSAAESSASDPKAAAQSSEAEASPGTASLTHETRQQLHALNGCEPGSEGCAYVEISYPEYRSPDSRLAEAINQAIHTTLEDLLMGYQPEETPTSRELEALAQGFLRDFQTVQQDLPDRSASWALEISCEPQAQTDQYLCLRFSSYSFTGGAHPNTYQENLCLRRIDATPLTLSELITDREALTRLGEQAFRDSWQEELPENLSEAGFYFPNNQFTLNENFLLGKEGITFHFNPYEVAPYAMGHISFLLPYAEIEHLLAADFQRDQ